ncbi:hypothetical protein AC249_AIPGENE2884 [Exaiptasia diaphana]|nr:hypothetical protein AC249_AIPGENE2884 [Exaiptasia diaphana]
MDAESENLSILPEAPPRGSESKGNQNSKVSFQQPDRSLQRYVYDELKTKSIYAKAVPFEEVDVNSYKPKTKLIAFSTTETRLPLWIKAITTRYLDILNNTDSFSATWEEYENLQMNGKSDKVVLTIRERDDKLFVISVFAGSLGKLIVLKTGPPTQVNHLIWDKLKHETRSGDLKLQRIQANLLKGIIPIISIVEKLVVEVLDVEALLKTATDSVAMLGAANFGLNMQRRDNIKPELNADYKHLCPPTVPFTEFLFGDDPDLSKQLKDLAEATKVSKKISKNHEPKQDLPVS